MTVDPIVFFGAVLDLLRVALVVAVGVAVVAAVWLVSRAASRRLERRFLPDVSRWSRRRAGLPEDAGPWACPACHSVNASTVVACYRCGGGRADGVVELSAAATDATVFHPPAPADRFDPSMYRGPGAPTQAIAAADARATPAAPRAGDSAGAPESTP